MANKIIKYTLTSNGTIPTFIEDGGYYAKANNNASPQDSDMIGVTVDGSSEEGLGVFANQAAIKTYLDTLPEYTAVHDITLAQDCLTSTDAAAWVWAKKID